MSDHSIVLMTDGQKVASDRKEGVGEALAAVRSLLGQATGPGCHRLTVDGPRVNGSLTVDAPPKRPDRDRR